MSGRRINQLSALAPIVMSLLAFGVVIAALLTGFERGETDEGATAHTFQLLIVAQAPVILLFLATADWRRVAGVARTLVLQGAALALAFGPVAYFRL